MDDYTLSYYVNVNDNVHVYVNLRFDGEEPRIEKSFSIRAWTKRDRTESIDYTLYSRTRIARTQNTIDIIQKKKKRKHIIVICFQKYT